MHAHNGYVRVFKGDIHACFDEISHTALLGRVRDRIKDKRVVALVRAFLKAGGLAEDGFVRDPRPGHRRAGSSPLLANIALGVLDEHFDAKWDAQGSTASARSWHRKKGGASYRLVRYADDFVVLVHGTDSHLHALRGEVEAVLGTVGLRLSLAKTHVVHIDQGFDFLGFRIQRHTQWGSNRRYVYTYPSQKALLSVRRKIKAITNRQVTDRDPMVVILELNRITRGWATTSEPVRQSERSAISTATCGGGCGGGCAPSTGNEVPSGSDGRTTTPTRGGRPLRDSSWITRHVSASGGTPTGATGSPSPWAA